MSTTIRRPKLQSAWREPVGSGAFTAFRLGWHPHYVRMAIEQGWYGKAFANRWYWGYCPPVFELNKVLEKIDDLRAAVERLINGSTFIATECGCVPALSTFRAYLEKQWNARWSLRARQAYARKKSQIPLSPVPVFESQYWQDFYGVSLEKLADRLNEPHSTFFCLGKHLGSVIYPCMNKVLSIRGWRDYRSASEDEAATTLSLLLKADYHWNSDKWWRGAWTWKDAISNLEAPYSEDHRYAVLRSIRALLERALRDSYLETPPFKPIQEVQGMFGLRAIVESTNPFLAVVYRDEDGTAQSPIKVTVKNECARIAVELIKARGLASKQILWGSSGTLSTDAMYKQISLARKQCFEPLGITVEPDRSLGYRLTAKSVPTKRVRRGAANGRSAAKNGKAAPRSKPGPNPRPKPSRLLG